MVFRLVRIQAAAEMHQNEQRPLVTAAKPMVEAPKQQILQVTQLS